MEVYQVLNSSGNPAGNDQHTLAVFKSMVEAQKWINYIVNECGVNDKFTIRPMYLYNSNLENACKDALGIAEDWFPDGLDEETTVELRERIDRIQATIYKNRKWEYNAKT